MTLSFRLNNHNNVFHIQNRTRLASCSLGVVTDICHKMALIKGCDNLLYTGHGIELKYHRRILGKNAHFYIDHERVFGLLEDIEL